MSNHVIRILLLTCAVISTHSTADEILVIVNPENPIDALDQKQIQQLFLGRMSLFPNSEIKVSAVDQNESSQAYQRFYKNVMNINETKLKRYRAYYLFSGKGQVPKTMDSIEGLLQYVSKNQNAIAYINKQDLKDSVKVVYPITK